LGTAAQNPFSTIKVEVKTRSTLLDICNFDYLNLTGAIFGGNPDGESNPHLSHRG
jgi:hypothetical protein